MRPAFVEGLREHGYIEGQNLVLESRYAESRFERLPGLAAELVRLKCDVIVAAVTQASLAARDATATIPIVMIGVADPVGAGLVGQPGPPRWERHGNLGRVHAGRRQADGAAPRDLPDVPRIAVLWNPGNPVYQALQLREAQIAARTLRVDLQLLEARSLADLERVFAAIPLDARCWSRGTRSSTPIAGGSPSWQQPGAFRSPPA